MTRMDTLLNVVFLCVFNGGFMVAGIFLNCVVVISLWRSTQLRKKLCYFTIFLLSCFDLAVVAIIHPLVIWWTIATFLKAYGKSEYEATNLIGMLLSGYSMLALLTLNLERFLALNYPFLHQKSITKRRLLLFLTCCCSLLTILIGLTFRNAIISLQKFAIIYLPVVLLLLLYFTYHIVEIAKAKREFNAAKTGENATKKRRINSIKKISACYLTVICCFTFSIPIIIHCGLCIGYRQPKEEKCNRTFGQWIMTVISINSTFNCLIFFWKNTILRREGVKIIKCCRISQSKPTHGGSIAHL